MEPTRASPGPALGEIGQIALSVDDVARAVAFYRDVIGLPFLFQPGPKLAFLMAGRVRLMVANPEGAGAKPGANSVLYFRVADLAATHAKLVARGASPMQEPHLVAKLPDHELWLSFVRDPEGNAIGLMEERR